MPITTWNPGLSVGVETLDADHQRLITTMNAVFDALLQGKSALTVRMALAELQQYVLDHFLREEKWMIESGYPAFEHHKREHNALQMQVVRLLALSEQSDDQLAVEMLFVLRDWLLGHIAHSDKTAANELRR